MRDRDNSHFLMDESYMTLSFSHSQSGQTNFKLLGIHFLTYLMQFWVNLCSGKAGWPAEQTILMNVTDALVISF